MKIHETRLYSLHPDSLNTAYSDIENVAQQQVQVFLGTAGTVLKRTNQDGFSYYTHQFYDGERKKRQEYLAGPTGSPEADAAAEEMRVRIEETKSIVPILRMLGREGFNVVDARTYATVGALHNHGIFRAGGILIGSHAYGVILNKLGVRAAQYKTEDVDIARREKLAFKRMPGKRLLDVLRDSGVDFVEVPSFRRGQPSTSFKKKGRGQFQVDLLVPSPDETFPTIQVPELGAHATALPYLRYLLAESQSGALLAREGCCSVNVPLPERFAVHKLVVSRLRADRGAKSIKDLDQATVLCAALSELHPGAIEEAVAALSKKMKKHFSKALSSVQSKLEGVAPRAWDELTSGT